MTTFDKREQAYEAGFVHDAEVRFKVRARADWLFGNWVASQLQLTGEAARAYADSFVIAEVENSDNEGVFDKASKDLAAKGVSEREIASKRNEFFQAALAQVEASK